jgi:hypothetical protein
MPRKTKQVNDYEVIENEPEPEPVKISIRTGKPTRSLTDLQKEVLAKGRALAVQKRKDLIAGIDLQKRAENIKKAKDELKLARDIKQQEKIQSQKKMYEDAVNEAVKDDEEDDDDEEEVIVKKTIKKDKKVKKKVIKYIEESSSDSEEEVIVRKKKDKTKAMMAEVSKQELRKRLENEQSNSLAKMLAPSYY